MLGQQSSIKPVEVVKTVEQIVAEESAEVAERHKARTAVSATEDHIYEVREWDPSSGEIKEVRPPTIHVVGVVRQ